MDNQRPTPPRLRAMQQSQFVVIYEQRISDAILDQPFGMPRVLTRVITIERASPDAAPMPKAA